MKLLITTRYNEKCRQELLSRFDEVVCLPATDLHSRKEDSMLELLAKEKPDALIVELDRVTKKVLDANPDLMFVGVCRANPVNVDVERASELNIPVLVTPARNAQAVAELCVGHLIMFQRNMLDAATWLKAGSWQDNPAYPFFHYKGNEVCGKKIGFVGFGAVGRALWHMLRAFGCEGVYYDPFLSDVIEDCSPTDIRTLFSECDIVSVHLPVNDSTKGLVTAELIGLMKPTSIFLNSSRAIVADYDALYERLSKKEIRGALLDVFPNEPPSEKDYKLIKLDNVLATPHIAGAADEVEDHHSRIMNAAIAEWLDHGRGRCVFNLNKLAAKE